jgi:hypothetical protein
LPDGFFSNQKSQFGQILEGFRWENVEIFYDHLEYFTAIWGYFMTIWCLLCSFGTFFPGFGIMNQKKSGNPGHYLHRHLQK